MGYGWRMGDLASSGVLTVPTVQALRDYTISDLPTVGPVQTLGALAAGDGGDGVWRYVSGAPPGTYTDNTGTIVLPTGGDGSAAMLRIASGDQVLAAWFGGDIQAALNAAAASGATAVSGAHRTFVISAAIDVPEGVALIDATLVPSGQHPCVTLCGGSAFRGTIDLSALVGYAGPAVYASNDGTTHSMEARTEIDAFVVGNNDSKSAIGVKVESLAGEPGISWIDIRGTFVALADCVIVDATANWANALRFDARFTRCLRGLTTLGTTCNGLTGTIYVQPHTAYADAQYALSLSGQNSNLEAYVWDWTAGNVADVRAIRLNATTQGRNRIVTNLDPGYIADAAQASSYSNDIYTHGGPGRAPLHQSIAPFSSHSRHFAGQQDNALAYANRTGTVTTTPAPSSGTIDRVFDDDYRLSTNWTNLEATIEITLPATLYGLSAVGCQFSYIGIPTAIAVYVNTGSGFSLVASTTTNARPDWSAGSLGATFGNATAIKFVLGAASETTAVLGLWAVADTGERQWLSRKGGTVYGNVEILQPGNGIVLRSLNGTYRKKLFLTNTGTLDVVDA